MNIKELLKLLKTSPRVWAGILNMPFNEVENWISTNNFPPEIEQRMGLIKNLLVEHNLLEVKLGFTIQDRKFQENLWVNEWNPQYVLATIQKSARLHEDLKVRLRELALTSNAEDQERNWAFNSTYFNRNQSN